MYWVPVVASPKAVMAARHRNTPRETFLFNMGRIPLGSEDGRGADNGNYTTRNRTRARENKTLQECSRAVRWSRLQPATGASAPAPRRRLKPPLQAEARSTQKRKREEPKLLPFACCQGTAYWTKF